MSHAEMSSWAWALCVFMCLGQHFMFGSARSEIPRHPRPPCGTRYIVVVPAVLHSGEVSRLCVTVLQPGDLVSVSVALRFTEEERTHVLDLDQNPNQQQNRNQNPNPVLNDFSIFNRCFLFRVPSVNKDSVQILEVAVQTSTFQARDSRKVLVKANDLQIFIQTSLPVYQPGYTVHFRVGVWDTKGELSNAVFHSIILTDPHNIRIGQWLNVTSSSKILDLSYILSPEACEGLYKIVVTTDKDKVETSFRVQRIALPRFNMKVNVPKKVTIGQESFEIVVCVKNKFGKPVQGQIKVKVCRPLNCNTPCSSALTHENPTDVYITTPCKTKLKQTHRSGCTAFQFKLSDFTTTDQEALLDVLDVSATVEEEGTCISQTKRERIKISYAIGRLIFFDVLPFFIPGRPYSIKVKAVDFTGRPVPDFKCYLFLGEKGSEVLVASIQINKYGSKILSINTFNFNKDMILTVSSRRTLEHPQQKTPFFLPATVRVQLLEPGAGMVKFLRVVTINSPLQCDSVAEVFIQYSLQKHKCGRDTALLFYYVISKGRFVDEGSTFIELNDEVTQGQFSFKLRVTPDLVPHIQVLTYVVLGCDKLLAHSAELAVRECVRDEVKVAFWPATAVPGQNVTLQLTAHPNSLCALNIFSKNVLKQHGAVLDAGKIFDNQYGSKGSPIPPELEESGECLSVKSKKHHGRVRRDGTNFHFNKFPCLNQNKEDPYTVARNVGVWFMTDFDIRSPTCIKVNNHKYFLESHQSQRPEPKAGELPSTCSDAVEPSHILPFYTLFFGQETVGNSGIKRSSFIVPDLTTSWVSEAFCFSSSGLSVAPRSQLNVTQPFFIHLTHTHSIILGESFIMTATVVNHLSRPLLIQLTPAHNTCFTLKPLIQEQSSFCLCGKKYKTLKWLVTPTATGVFNMTLTAKAVSSHTLCCETEVIVPENGHIDVETQLFTVKAGGTEIIKTYNWLLCPQGNPLTKKIDTRIPPNVITESVRVKVSVAGDSFASAIHWLGEQVQIHYRNGYQNIAFMAMDACLLHYLNNTHQLTPEIKKRGSQALAVDYQAQLNYRDKKGGFSIYPSGPPSPWLTAMVLNTFYKAQAFIYIDQKIYEASIVWLESQQQDNGCFKASGDLLSKNIKNDEIDEVCETASIIGDLIGMNISTNNPVVKRGLTCLKNSIRNINDFSVKARLAYVFKKAGLLDISSNLLHYLKQDLLRWLHADPTTSTPLTVGAASYVLLAELCNSVSAKDWNTAPKIVEWLLEKKDRYGNHISLQESVVAYQAVALYYTQALFPSGESRVTLWSPGCHLTFFLNQYNRLENQETTLQDIKGKYNVKVEGTTCAVVEVFVQYNVPTTTTTTISSDLSVEVWAVIKSSQIPGQKVTLKLKSLYQGNGGCTNTVILEIQISSGYTPLAKSLRKLRNAQQVLHVEHRDSRVILTLQELCKDRAVIHTLKLVREYEVLQLQPSPVKLYELHYPCNGAHTHYTLGTSESPRPCHVSKGVEAIVKRIFKTKLPRKRIFSQPQH